MRQTRTKGPIGRSVEEMSQRSSGPKRANTVESGRVERTDGGVVSVKTSSKGPAPQVTPGRSTPLMSLNDMGF